MSAVIAKSFKFSFDVEPFECVVLLTEVQIKKGNKTLDFFKDQCLQDRRTLLCATVGEKCVK